MEKVGSVSVQSSYISGLQSVCGICSSSTKFATLGENLLDLFYNPSPVRCTRSLCSSFQLCAFPVVRFHFRPFPSLYYYAGFQACSLEALEALVPSFLCDMLCMVIGLQPSFSSLRFFSFVLLRITDRKWLFLGPESKSSNKLDSVCCCGPLLVAISVLNSVVSRVSHSKQYYEYFHDILSND